MQIAQEYLSVRIDGVKAVTAIISHISFDPATGHRKPQTAFF